MAFGPATSQAAIDAARFALYNFIKALDSSLEGPNAVFADYTPAGQATVPGLTTRLATLNAALATLNA